MLKAVSFFQLKAPSCCPCPLCPFCATAPLSKVLSSPSSPGSTSPKWGLTVPRLSPRSPVNPIITLRGPAGCSRCHNSPNITATATSFQQPAPRENFFSPRNFLKTFRALQEASWECSVWCLVVPSESCQRQAWSLVGVGGGREGAEIQVIR